MKFASFPKFFLSSALVGVLVLALAGCGGTSNLALTPGNWSVTAVSSNGNGTYYVGGNLAAKGSSVTGTMYVMGSLCFDPSQGLAITGKIHGKEVTLTSAAFNGSIITVKASGSTGDALSGTYSVSAGTDPSCTGGDTGTATANVVPSISGTWNGSFTDSLGEPVTLSVALTQATTASADGTFPLTGTLTYTGSTCMVDGTIGAGNVAGSYIQLNNGLVNEQGDTQGNVSYMPALLDSSTAPKNMTGDYEYSGVCSTDSDTITLTKQ